jgi:hypothetical protein
MIAVCSSSVRIFPVQMPAQGILSDVLTNAVQEGIVADDVFIIIALPQPTAEWRPSGLFDAADIFIGGHRFEPLNDFR